MENLRYMAVQEVLHRHAISQRGGAIFVAGRLELELKYGNASLIWHASAAVLGLWSADPGGPRERSWRSEPSKKKNLLQDNRYRMHWGSSNGLQVGLGVREGQKLRTAALAFQRSTEIHVVICVSEIPRATTQGRTNGHVSSEAKMTMPKWHAEFILHCTSFESWRYMVVAFNEY